MQSILLSVVILFISYFQVKSQTAQQDLVDELPGFGPTSYDIYSGMLDVTSTGSRQLHYVLIESQSNPSTDPLVIWLNGGPGCSSLLGMIQENGPFLFQGDNTFLTDMQATSWNNNANVLYIEGPPGVGFSVNKETLSYKYTDPNTAQDFLSAYLVFQQRFQGIINFSNGLWLSGESYAGMYVPYFAKAILDYNAANTSSQIKLLGLMIGNNVQIMSEALLTKFTMNQFVENQFFSPELREQFYQVCTDSLNTVGCIEFMQTYKNVTDNVDAYSIYNYTYSYKASLSAQQTQLLNYNSQDEEQSEFVKLYKEYVLKRSKDYIESVKSSDRTWQTPDEIITAYFNLEEVQAALHVPKTNWQECSTAINLLYRKGTPSNALYQYFVKAGLDILIFSGNSDAVVPWQYTEYCIDQLMTNSEYAIKLTKNGNWRQWTVTENQQVGGMVQYYKTETGSRFAYAMVRAAGHEVPMYQPLAAFQMFNNFIQGKQI